MITYLLITAPMAALAVFTGSSIPPTPGSHEVELRTEPALLRTIAFIVIATGAFWFILDGSRRQLRRQHGLGRHKLHRVIPHMVLLYYAIAYAKRYRPHNPRYIIC